MQNVFYFILYISHLIIISGFNFVLDPLIFNSAAVMPNTTFVDSNLHVDAVVFIINEAKKFCEKTFPSWQKLNAVLRCKFSSSNCSPTTSSTMVWMSTPASFSLFIERNNHEILFFNFSQLQIIDKGIKEYKMSIIYQTYNIILSFKNHLWYLFRKKAFFQ